MSGQTNRQDSVAEIKVIRGLLIQQFCSCQLGDWLNWYENPDIMPALKKWTKKKKKKTLSRTQNSNEENSPSAKKINKKIKMNE